LGSLIDPTPAAHDRNRCLSLEVNANIGDGVMGDERPLFGKSCFNFLDRHSSQRGSETSNWSPSKALDYTPYYAKYLSMSLYSNASVRSCDVYQASAEMPMMLVSLS
jgi:hypothetical protein